ncbi:hypothetical protein GE09DRAFT_1089393 [Coniochaeta sp. 2T2.1]|nr:hypothetical protein GE09DRAFT_1089393 [Coniochaeta sp. 2T2.1]
MAPTQDDIGAFVTRQPYVSHKYTVIPSDQQEFLDRPDSWDTVGVPYFPPKALQAVKDAFILRLKGTGVENRPSTRNSRGDDTTHNDESSIDSDDEEDEDPIPWTPSPTSHKQAPTRHPDEHPNLRPPNVPPPLSSPLGPSHTHVLSSPPVAVRKPSPNRNLPRPPAKSARGAPVTIVKASARALQQEPPSSLDSEPGLEFSPPKAITDVVSPSRLLRSDRAKPSQPVNKFLRSVQVPAQTPPSAQEPESVSCTFQEGKRPPSLERTADEPPKKKKRLMKPPPFPPDSPKEEPPKSNALPSAKSQAPIGLDDTQNTNSSSGHSVIPSSASRPYDTPIIRRRSTVPPQDPPISSEANEPDEDSPLSSSGRLPPNGPASQAPYVAFTNAYPSYQGTPRDFVSAALYVLHLQRTRALAEFLYDDFIRVWAQDYIDYIKNYDDDHSQPLTAIQWYNQNVTRPVYMKGIFTGGNIADIPKYLPAEAELVRNESRKIHESTPEYASSLLAARSSAAPGSSAFQSGLEEAGQNSSPPAHDTSLPAEPSSLIVEAAISQPIDESQPTGSLLPTADDRFYTPSAEIRVDVDMSVTLRAGREALPPIDEAAAQALQVVSIPMADSQVILQSGQVESIEPLRTVPGYVMTMSQSTPTSSRKSHDQPAALTPTISKVKEEEKDRGKPQEPATKPKPAPRDSKSVTPRATPQKDRQPVLSRASLRQSSASQEPTKSVAEKLVDAALASLHNPTPRPPPSSSPRTKLYTPRAQRPSPARPNSQEPSLEDILTQPPATAGSFAKPSGSRLSRPPATRPKSPEPSVEDVFTQPPATAGSYAEPPQPSRREQHARPSRSPQLSSGNMVSQRPAKAGSFAKPSVPQRKKPPPPSPPPDSPRPSFGDILTQPPATAGSFMSDFARSESIPETVVKPKHVSRFQPGPSKDYVPSALNPGSSKLGTSSVKPTPAARKHAGSPAVPASSATVADVNRARKPPSSSAVPASSGSMRRQKLSKVDRFGIFCEKFAREREMEKAKSLTPKSTAGK